MFLESFEGSRTQFQRLVMLGTDVFVTADLYQAKRVDKPRNVWRDKKICCCSYMSIHCLFAYGSGIWNFILGNEGLYRCAWRNIRFLTQIGLVSSIQSLWIVNITMPCCVTAVCLCKIIEKSVIGECFVFCSWNLILDLILDSLIVLDSWFAQESRIANQVQNWDSQWTVNLLLNGTVREGSNLKIVK